jgi:hypothetical protein
MVPGHNACAVPSTTKMRGDFVVHRQNFIA